VRGLLATRLGGDGVENIMDGPGPSSVATVVRGTSVEESLGTDDWRIVRGLPEGRRWRGSVRRGCGVFIVTSLSSFVDVGMSCSIIVCCKLAVGMIGRGVAGVDSLQWGVGDGNPSVI